MLLDFFRRRRFPVATTAPALGEFLDRNAALISQKSLNGYCLVKTMLPLHELMRDKPFVDAYEKSRWECYAAVLADLVTVAERYMRPHAGGHQRETADALAAVFARTLANHPIPAHRPQGWEPDVEAVRARLAAAQETLPLSIAEISKVGAQRVFDSMPIHERLREADAPAIMANVTFLMVGLARDFERQVDYAAVMRDLLRAPSPA